MLVVQCICGCSISIVSLADSDLMLNRGDVSGLRAIREDDIVLV